MEHQLEIKSLRDAEAVCSCGLWEYNATTSDTETDSTIKNQIQWSFDFHKKTGEPNTENKEPQRKPGEWYVEMDGATTRPPRAMNIRCEPTEENAATYICEMLSTFSPEQTLKNAVLIATAPKLLEACALMYNVAANALGDAFDPNDKFFVEARAAIAEAQGKAKGGAA